MAKYRTKCDLCGDEIEFQVGYIATGQRNYTGLTACNDCLPGNRGGEHFVHNFKGQLEKELKEKVLAYAKEISKRLKKNPDLTWWESEEHKEVRSR